MLREVLGTYLAHHMSPKTVEPPMNPNAIEFIKNIDAAGVKTRC